jgi:hypothetical protein
MTILFSDVQEANWYFNDEYMDSEVHIPEGHDITLDVEIQGLYFYPKKFGIRWIARNVYVNSGEQTEGVSSDNDIDKLSIEECWRHDIEDVCINIDKDIMVLESKIKDLQELKVSLKSELQQACELHTTDSSWDKKLHTLAKKCAAYFGGYLL